MEFQPQKEQISENLAREILRILKIIQINYYIQILKEEGFISLTNKEKFKGYYQKLIDSERLITKYELVYFKELADAVIREVCHDTLDE